MENTRDGFQILRIENGLPVVWSEDDRYLFNEGNHFYLYNRLGAHPCIIDGQQGCYFAVWAPNAKSVSVFGGFNDWNKESHPMRFQGGSGIWELFVPGAVHGMSYKYHVVSHHQGFQSDRADPMARYAEVAPHTASRIWDMNYEWQDAQWMGGRAKNNALDAPMSIYEMHLGSWRRVPEEEDRPLTYRELARVLPEYLNEMEYTHVEFLPVMEHPYYPSWGYQTLGLFAPTSRYGAPEDFMYLVDRLHQAGIGVILDWVPSHFPSDGHGLAYFDGTHLYEHADRRQGFHPDWSSFIYNYGRHEVQSFLISSAMYWYDRFHIDGLRVDAVASMLYLNYSRKEGEWIPNKYGGHENLEAIHFLRRLNEVLYQNFPDTQTIAEESTSWPMVSRPLYVGGLGFGMKWDMGWMHDTLQYFQNDPVHRRFHHNNLTFRMIYAYHENFVLSLSHDEVVHGKGSLINKMPGDEWQKCANLRLLFAYMFAQPGRKLLFMGAELGQYREWDFQSSLDWHLLENPLHRGIHDALRDLNHLYRTEPALHKINDNPEGFDWIDCNDSDQSVISLARKTENPEDTIVIACNFTPVVRYNYRIGLPLPGQWREIFNSDAPVYGGSGVGSPGVHSSEDFAFHARNQSMTVNLPPLGALFFKFVGNSAQSTQHDLDANRSDDPAHRSDTPL